MGVVYNNLNKYKEAIELHKKAIELRPNDKAAYGNMGISYTKLGNYEEAMKYYKKVLELDPNDSIAHYNIACAYSLKKDKYNVLKYLELAIDKGYDELELIEKDSDFDFIRKVALEEYRRIIEKLKAKK